jgi:hypothetical protein
MHISLQTTLKNPTQPPNLIQKRITIYKIDAKSIKAPNLAQKPTPISESYSKTHHNLQTRL